MSKLKRTLGIMVVCSMIAAILMSGCSKAIDKNTSDNADAGSSSLVQDSKQVKLRWIHAGPGKQQDSVKVWAEFNKQLQTVLPNTTVEIDAIDLTKIEEKFKLIAASGEDYDIVWTGYKNDYTSNVKKGAFLELDSLLQNVAPDLRESMPDWLWEKCKVDGKTYAIPCYGQMTDTNVGLKFQKALIEKYGDRTKLEKTLLGTPFVTKEIYDMLTDYLQKAKDGNDLRKGVGVETLGTFLVNKGMSAVYGQFEYARNEKAPKVVNMYERPEYKLMIDTHADWFKKGFIRKDILSIQNRRADEKKEDGYILWSTGHYNSFPDFPQINQDQIDTAAWGYPSVSIPFYDKYFINMGEPVTMLAIGKASSNPERALKFLEVLYTDKGKELYNMLVYGLEGVNYKKISADRVETIGYSGQSTSDAPYGLWKWTTGNTFNAWYVQTDADGSNEFALKAMDTADKSALIDFKVNIEPVKNELAQIAAVEKEYQVSLYSGSLSDYEAKYKEFIAKMKTAGSDKVKSEFQNQIDAYLKSKGK